MSFQDARLIDATIIRTTMSDTDFSNATLPGVSFTGSTLQGVTFRGSSLENASFRDAKFEVSPGSSKGVDLACTQLGAPTLPT